MPDKALAWLGRLLPMKQALQAGLERPSLHGLLGGKLKLRHSEHVSMMHNMRVVGVCDMRAVRVYVGQQNPTVAARRNSCTVANMAFRFCSVRRVRGFARGIGLG